MKPPSAVAPGSTPGGHEENMNAITDVGANEPDLNSYDRILVAFSGGKDSLACVLHLLDLGLKDKIELHHHDVDGAGTDHFMDWPCTRPYVMEVAKCLGLPVFFSYKEGGFYREMLRDGNPTAPITFHTTTSAVTRGGRGPAGTRQKFPQVSADLRVPWCSAYLKIDVLDAVIRGQARFEGARTLVVTGERAEESPNRARYKAFEQHRADARGPRLRRHVDTWRPILRWLESDVWNIMQDHGIVPHPAYYLGWGRLSCMTCIFGSPNQWASIQAIAPGRLATIEEFEIRFDKTIHRTRSVRQSAAKGKPYPAVLAADDELIRLAMTPADRWLGGPLMVPPDAWKLPPGAFGESAGPN
jgi:3'-phosphoadenosine 5'-phosphosulfate sulfotransferase (PAPS reductase)/FAD synthetase